MGRVRALFFFAAQGWRQTPTDHSRLGTAGTVAYAEFGDPTRQTGDRLPRERGVAVLRGRSGVDRGAGRPRRDPRPARVRWLDPAPGSDAARLGRRRRGPCRRCPTSTTSPSWAGREVARNSLADGVSHSVRVCAPSTIGSFAPFTLILVVQDGQWHHTCSCSPISLSTADRQASPPLVADFAQGWVEDPETSGFGGESPPADEAVEVISRARHPNLKAQIREGLRRGGRHRAGTRRCSTERGASS